jgi:hypothetical protein
LCLTAAQSSVNSLARCTTSRQYGIPVCFVNTLFALFGSIAVADVVIVVVVDNDGLCM